MIKFKNNNFGTCELIAVYKDVYLIRLQNNYEPYSVTFNLDILSGSWRCGNYFRSFDDAITFFKHSIHSY